MRIQFDPGVHAWLSGWRGPVFWTHVGGSVACLHRFTATSNNALAACLEAYWTAAGCSEPDSQAAASHTAAAAASGNKTSCVGRIPKVDVEYATMTLLDVVRFGIYWIVYNSLRCHTDQLLTRTCTSADTGNKQSPCQKALRCNVRMDAYPYTAPHVSIYLLNRQRLRE